MSGSTPQPDKFRSIFDEAPIGIFQSSAEGRLLNVNMTGARMFGYDTPEEALEAITDTGEMLFVHPEQRRQMVDEILNTDGFVRRENEYRRRDGSTFMASLYARAVRKDGEVAYIEGFVDDISEHKRAENELNESRRKLKLVLDTIPVRVFWKDTNLSYQGCNRAFAVDAGLASSEEIVGLTDYDMPWVDQAESYREDDADVIDSGEPKLNYEEEQTTSDGRTIWLRTSKIPLKDHLGQVVGLMGSYEETTEAKRTEEALVANETLLRQFVEHTPAAVAMFDTDVRYLLWSKRWLTDYQLGDRDLTGLSHYEVFPDVPDRWRADHQYVLAGNVISCEEDKFERADGSVVWIKWEVHPWWNSAGEIGGIIMFTEVITKRIETELALRESEEKFRTLFESANDAILILDSGTLVDCNERTLEIYGCTSRDQIVGKTTLDFSPPYQADGRSSAEAAIEKINAALAGRPQSFEYLQTRYDGSQFYAEVSLHRIELQGQVRLQAIVRDITERKRAEAEKREFYRQSIMSVTDGKLQICDAQDVGYCLEDAEVNIEVVTANDMPKARAAITAFCARQGLAGARLEEFIIAAGEAITNAVKHGSAGRVCAGAGDEEVWISVSDKGPGIDSLILPKAVLRRGFSTKPSLGLGYSIMLEVADRILLSTGPDGTTVVLIKSIRELPPPSLVDIVNTWDGIERPATRVRTRR